MNRTRTAWLAAGLMALVATACFKDPTASLQGSASRLTVTKSFFQHNVGDTTVINVQVLDAQGNPLPISNVTYASLDTTVANIIPLSDSVLRTVPGGTLTKADVISTGAGTTKLTVSANGLTDTLTVISYPVAFTGVVTPATIHPGDTVTITTPAGVTFNATATAAMASGLGFYKFVSRTATTLKYIAGTTAASPGATYTVTGGVLLGTIPLPTLTGNTKIIVTDPNDPANDLAAGAPSMGTLTAAGDSLVKYGSMDPNDLLDHWKFTMNTTGTVSVSLSFDGDGSGTGLNPDYDVVVCLSTALAANGTCDYANDLIPGNAASASNNPEAGTTSVIPAGSTVIVRTYAYTGAGGVVAGAASGYRLRVKTP